MPAALISPSVPPQCPLAHKRGGYSDARPAPSVPSHTNAGGCVQQWPPVAAWPPTSGAPSHTNTGGVQQCPPWSRRVTNSLTVRGDIACSSILAQDHGCGPSRVVHWLSHNCRTASVGRFCAGQLAMHMASTGRSCRPHRLALALALGPQIVGALQTRALDSAPAPLPMRWP